MLLNIDNFVCPSTYIASVTNNSDINKKLKQKRKAKDAHNSSIDMKLKDTITKNALELSKYQNLNR